MCLPNGSSAGLGGSRRFGLRLVRIGASALVKVEASFGNLLDSLLELSLADRKQTCALVPGSRKQRLSVRTEGNALNWA